MGAFAGTSKQRPHTKKNHGMARIKFPPEVKLICGILLADEHAAAGARSRLTEAFGPVDFSSRILPFHYTRYYSKEMGENLRREFIGFSRLVPREMLPEIKVKTNEIEEEFARTGKEGILRTVNLDPGYISEAHLCLATTKNSAHRIYLGKGIYGDVQLWFHKNGTQVMPWTYPDYRTEAYHSIFTEIRKIYRAQLNQSV
jgi:hypothetical protein